MSELISQAELARRRGCTRQYISKLVKLGKLTLTKGKVDFAAAEQILDALADPSRNRPSKKKPSPKSNGQPAPKSKPKAKATPHTPPTAPSGFAASSEGEEEEALNEGEPEEYPSFAISAKRREYWRANDAQLKALEQAGALGWIKDMERAYHQAFRALRDSILEVPPRLCFALAAETDPHEITQLLTPELRQALSGMEKPPEVKSES